MEKLLTGDDAPILWALAIACATAVIMWMARTVVQARRLAKAHDQDRDAHISDHRFCVIMLDLFIVATVGCIEILISLNDGLWVRGILYWIHMILVITFVALWISLHVKNGLRYKHHARLAYTFVAVATFTLISGGWMLKQYPSI